MTRVEERWRVKIRLRTVCRLVIDDRATGSRSDGRPGTAGPLSSGMAAATGTGIPKGIGDFSCCIFMQHSDSFRQTCLALCCQASPSSSCPARSWHADARRSREAKIVTRPSPIPPGEHRQSAGVRQSNRRSNDHRLTVKNTPPLIVNQNAEYLFRRPTSLGRPSLLP